MAPRGPSRHGFRKPKNAKQALLRLLGYLAKQKWHLLIVMFFVMVSTLAGVAGTYMLRPIINEAILPQIGKDLADVDFAPLIRMVTIIACIYIAGALSTFAQSRIMIGVSNRLLNTVRRDLFNHMQDLSIPYFDTHTHGELMSRYTSDVDALREFINHGFIQFITSLLTIISTFIMMMILSPLLTVLIIIMIVIMVSIVKTIGKRSAANFKKQQMVLGEMNGYIEEMMEGQKVIKVFHHEDVIKENFEVKNENLRKAATNAHLYANVMMPIMGNLSYFNYAMTAAAGAFLIIKGIMDLGTVAPYLQYTRTFSQPITQISQQFNSILAALAGAERIFEVMEVTPETDDGIVSLEEREGEKVWRYPDGREIPVRGDIRLKDVTFSYDGKKTVLHNVDLYAKPGQKIAFVGSTGAGKTTITNLINRFYDVEEGEITYDGIPIKEIKKKDLRRSLAMVLQDTNLFTGTVMENIRYGNPDATEEQIYEAAKLANADTFIRHLPRQYETVLTANGANLSQGQRQLLTIARAAVADPAVLILDEATSSIDTRTEALIEKGMDQLMKGRTVLVIAHRLSTVRNSDAIMVLENGCIIERGDHDELLERKGKYYQLYTGQFELE